MTATATLAAAEQTDVPTLTRTTHLAPPFGVEWTRFVSPVPRGWWASAQLDSGTGFGVLKLGALPRPQDPPAVTIAWFWAGWRRRVSVPPATVFVVDVHCNRVVFNGSGNFVPSCFVTLRPIAGGPEMVGSVRLFSGRSTRVVVAPQSPILPAAVQYDLSVAFNIRAAYIWPQNPQGELQATITEVQSYLAFPTAAAGAAELAAAPSDAPEPEDGGLESKELAAALAELGRTAKMYKTKSDRDALTDGLVSLGE